MSSSPPVPKVETRDPSGRYLASAMNWALDDVIPEPAATISPFEAIVTDFRAVKDKGAKIVSTTDPPPNVGSDSPFGPNRVNANDVPKSI
jgi:hypothetical protein